MIARLCLVLLSLAASSTTNADGRRRRHLRTTTTTNQDTAAIPLTIHAIVSPSPLIGKGDMDRRAAQCLVVSFQAIQRRHGKPGMILSTTRATQVMGSKPLEIPPVKPKQPTSSPSVHRVSPDKELLHLDDDDDYDYDYDLEYVLEETLPTFSPTPQKDDSPYFHLNDDDTEPLILPPEEREDQDMTFVQGIAAWVHSLMVHLGLAEPSSSVTVTTAAPSMDRSIDVETEPETQEEEELGCVLCPEDDDDGLHEESSRSSSPTTSDVLGCELCPEDDDDGALLDLRQDGSVIQLNREYQGHHRHRRLNRAMWTFDGLLERQLEMEDNKNNNQDLWLAFTAETESSAWADRFCECFVDEAALIMVEPSAVTTCQIHYTSMVY